MSAILFRVAIGAEGVAPGDVRMESTDDLVTITQPGYLNLNDGGTQINETDIITATYGPNQTKQLFTATIQNGVITLVAFGGGGSINGAVNLGSGQGLLGVSGDNITGKSLIAGANITLTPTATDVTIAATGSGGGTITGIADAGIGQGHLAAGTSGADVLVKTIVQGSGVIVTENGTTVTIAAEPVSGGLTTLANLPGGEGIYASTVGTVAQLKSISAGAGIDVSSNANNIIITNVGSGGEGFRYENTYWIASNGNDANDGLSINTPKLTLLGVETLLSTTPTVINIVDAGVYDLPSTFTVSCPLLINAPGATFNWTGADAGLMFFLNTFSPLIITVGQILANGANVFRGFSSIICTCPIINMVNSRRIWEDSYVFAPDGVPQAIFNISVAGPGSGSFVFKYVGEQIINASNLGNGQISSQLPTGTGQVRISADDYNGLLSGAADFNLNIGRIGSSFSITSSGVISGMVNGTLYGVTANTFYNDLNLQENSITREVYNYIYTSPSSGSWSFIPGFQNSNGQIVVTNTPNGNITMSPGSQFVQGARFTIIQTVRNSGVTLAVQAPDTICGQPSGTTSCYTGRGKAEIIRGPSNGAGGYTWIVTGDVFNSNLLAVNIFISQVAGNDSDADGSLNSQFATINAALAYVIATYTSTPAHGMNLVITDDSTYNEQLDFTGTSNINLIGREARISYSGAGDAITVDNLIFISLGTLAATGGGNALVSNDASFSNTVIANIDSVTNGAVVNNGNSIIFLQSFALFTQHTITGGGQLIYQTLYRAGGLDGAGVQGNSTDSAISWNVKGAITTGTTGSAGSLVLNPTTAATGSLQVIPTSNTANVITELTNQASGTATVHSLPSTSLTTSTLMNAMITHVDPSSNLIYTDTSLSTAALASGGTVTVLPATTGGRYAVRNIILNYSATPFAGGGDRNLAITDAGGVIWTIIPAAWLHSLNANALWGSVNVPLPAFTPANIVGTAGQSIYAQYSGGTADYGAGYFVSITMCCERIS